MQISAAHPDYHQNSVDLKTKKHSSVQVRKRTKTVGGGIEWA